MAAFTHTCANAKIVIHQSDHPPPHCHVKIKGKDVRVNLFTLEVFWDDFTLPANLRKCLKRIQEDMIAAWDDVTLTDEAR